MFSWGVGGECRFVPRALFIDIKAEFSRAAVLSEATRNNPTPDLLVCNLLVGFDSEGS